MFILNSVLAVAVAGTLPTDAPTHEQVKATIQRSLPFIQQQGARWIKEKNCVSCHQVNTMIWSLSAARQNGFDVSDQLDDWVTWAADSSLSTDDEGRTVGLANKEGVAQIVLALEGNADRDGIRQELATLLLDGQQPDGSWKPGGQLPSQKRPSSETTGVSTMWLALALIHEGPAEHAAAVVDRAMKFIQRSPPGKSTEWYAVQLLLAVQTKDQARRDHFVKELRQHQLADGGWGWLVEDKSDALGTGMALYALARAGLNKEHPSINRAQQFLVTHQREDGSWSVQGTKAARKNQIQETTVYWGTAWATLGLITSLSENPGQNLPNVSNKRSLSQNVDPQSPSPQPSPSGRGGQIGFGIGSKCTITIGWRRRSMD